VTGGDLLVVVPWLLFAASMATIGVLVVRRRSPGERGGGRPAAGPQETAERADDGRIAEGQEMFPGVADTGECRPAGDGPEAGYRGPGYGRPGADGRPGPGSRPGPARERD
jgi:hypothetical protein